MEDGWQTVTPSELLHMPKSTFYCEYEMHNFKAQSVAGTAAHQPGYRNNGEVMKIGILHPNISFLLQVGQIVLWAAWP